MKSARIGIAESPICGIGGVETVDHEPVLETGGAVDHDASALVLLGGARRVRDDIGEIPAAGQIIRSPTRGR